MSKKTAVTVFFGMVGVIIITGILLMIAVANLTSPVSIVSTAYTFTFLNGDMGVGLAGVLITLILTKFFK